MVIPKLPPTIVNVIILGVGLTLGWFGHANWVLRGEAKQIVEDNAVGEELEDVLNAELIELRARILDADKRFTDECLDYAADGYIDSLRDDSGTPWIEDYGEW